MQKSGVRTLSLLVRASSFLAATVLDSCSSWLNSGFWDVFSAPLSSLMLPTIMLAAFSSAATAAWKGQLSRKRRT